MKADLSTATMTAAIFVLASSALVGTNAMGATSTTGNTSAVRVQAAPFKLQCGGFGEKEVFFQNVGHGPVPAGTVVLWQLPKETHLIGGSDVTFPPQRGYYTFQQPLSPDGQAAINVPPPPPNEGGYVPPETVPLVLEFLRTCTLSVVPSNIRRAP
jgi:hypothetical protein